MDLTPRQQAFLSKLVELYNAGGRAVHYSIVAQALGVSRYSAYDMLRLLETKGLVASEYHLDSTHSSPGRSSVFFYPTHNARFLMSRHGDLKVNEDWNRFRAEILQRLRGAYKSDPLEALRDALSNLRDCRSPLEFCARMIGALLLNLNGALEIANDHRVLSALRSGGEWSLGTLIGLSIGSTLSKTGDVSVLDQLLACTRQYQRYLQELSYENRRRLAGFLQEALAIFST
ncbi:MAG: hypothetical protein H5T64_03000 [Chloroflexi bacterium]|nr:hypothetical protein [Chloroflexota bacterium]